MKRKNSFDAIRQTLLRVLFFNWLVAAVKILLGSVTNSAAILADGFHSFSDGASNIVGLVGLRMAAKPKDPDHPYGHRKIENFTAIGIAMMLFLLCWELIKNVLHRLILAPAEIVITPRSFTVLIATIAVNVVVMRYEYNRGKKFKSEILVADSHHTRSDIYVSLVVIAGLVGTKMGFYRLDSLISVVVIFLIGHVAFDVLMRTSKVLCDAAVFDPNFIKHIVMSIEGVNGCHQVRTRGREDEVMVDLHVTVDKAMHVDKAHGITERIEGRIKKSFTGISEVIVHIEPIGER